MGKPPGEGRNYCGACPKDKLNNNCFTPQGLEDIYARLRQAMA
jgi:hypothetical protein